MSTTSGSPRTAHQLGATEESTEVTETGLDERPGIGALLSDVSQDLSDLVRQEIELAKAEAKQSATRAGKGAGLLAAAGVAAFFVLLFLSYLLWWGLGNSLGRAWSALVTAGVWAVIAIVLALVGRQQLHAVPGLERTTETVKEIPPALKPDRRSTS